MNRQPFQVNSDIRRTPSAGQWQTIHMLGLGEKHQLPTLLLIDDDMVSREVLATVLTMSGHIVHTADSGDSALMQLASDKCAPGVILMDAQMPGLSGTRLIEELRARSSALVYAISASKASDEVVAAADGFLLKPFAAEDLHSLLAEHEAQVEQQVEERLTAAVVVDPDHPIVDAHTLAQLRALMPDASVREIYAAVVEDLYKRLGELETAFVNGDTTQVARIGHTIKGGCSMAGAVQAARLGAFLESGMLEAAPTEHAPTESWASHLKGNHLDNNTRVLRELRAATRNLERMLETEFPA